MTVFLEPRIVSLSLSLMNIYCKVSPMNEVTNGVGRPVQRCQASAVITKPILWTGCEEPKIDSSELWRQDLEISSQ